ASPSGERPIHRSRAGTAAAISIAIVASAAWLWFPRRGRQPPPMRTEAVPRQITTGSGLDGWPTFAPDGNSIAYSSDRSGHFEVWIRQLGAGGREIAVTSDGGQNVQPAWSPDGTQIAFCSAGRGGIWIVPSFGGAARQLTDFGSSPAWSPDGSRIVFQSDDLADFGASGYPAYSPSTIRTVSIADRKITPVTRPNVPPGGHGLPSWSPDGKTLVFVAYDLGT